MATLTPLPLDSVAAPVEFGLLHDRFTLGRALSNGGQGVVHVCTRNENGEAFAVKVIDRRLLQENLRNEVLLRREIRTLRELVHPHVVSLHEAFWEHGSCFIVMDLAREGDLREKIEYHVGIGEDPLSSERASVYVVRQLVNGLSCMHQRRVLHRDLKADNILVKKALRAKGQPPCFLYDVMITDFGLSTWLDIVGEAMTPCGTPNYLAPEVMKESYDERVDFWSLGVVNYMMLCGEFPFDMYHNPADAEKVLMKEVRMNTGFSSVSEQAQSFTRGLLAFDPSERLSHGRCLRHPWLAQGVGAEDRMAAWSEPDEITEKESENGDAAVIGLAGSIATISGWTGSAVDSIHIHSRDGSQTSYGTSNGGWSHGQYSLEPDEVVVAVAQETRTEVDGTLGNGLAFYTSSGKVVALQGEDARHRGRFAVPFGHQVVGLQFAGSFLTGIHIKTVPDNGMGDVKSISGRTGYAVDQVVLELRDGKSRRYGTKGGFDQGPWELEYHELIVAVEQGRREEFLGNSIVFYTSLGRVIKLSGMEASISRRFMASAGNQICGIELVDGLLVGTSVCPQHVSNPKADEVQTHPVS